MITENEHIDALHQAVEEALGRSLSTAKDFDQLSERIFARTGEMVSRNTLRRIWGRLGDEVMPRPSTLSILARFLGYADYKAFCTGTKDSSVEGDSSSPFFGRRLSVIDGLTRGDKIRLTWRPGRVCDVQYNGSLHFNVVRSENTRLKPGDTFLCGVVIEGQPLYLDQLQQGSNPPTAYICGKNGGVFFERLEED